MAVRRNPSRSRTAARTPEVDDDFISDSHSPEPSSRQNPTDGDSGRPTEKAQRPTGEKTFTNAQMSSLRKQAGAATLRNQIDQAAHA
jgi:hypothetical protein